MWVLILGYKKETIEVFFADFETEAEPFVRKFNYIKIWAWAITNSEGTKKDYGVKIEDFIEWLIKNGSKNNKIFFHNGAKFDYHFLDKPLIRYALKRGITVQNERLKDGLDGLYIKQTGDNKIMEIKFFIDGKKFTFGDSALIVPGASLKMLGEQIGLKGTEAKGTMDFLRIRDYHKRTQLTKAEKHYLFNDVEIMRKYFAQHKYIDLRTHRMTSSGETWYAFKKETTEKLVKENNFRFKKDTSISAKRKYCNKIFKNMFPAINYDAWKKYSQWYYGGFTYLNPDYTNKLIEQNVKQYDVNSLYPYVMRANRLPFGEPLPKKHMLRLFKNKELLDDKYFTLFEVVPLSDLRIKKGYHPFLGFGNTYKKMSGSEVDAAKGFIYPKYIKRMAAPRINLPTPLLIRFLKYYEGEFFYKPIYTFKTQKNYYEDYMQKWEEIKSSGKTAAIKATNKATAKLRMNGLYGKTGQKVLFDSKLYEILPNGEIINVLYKENIELLKPENRDELNKKEGLYILTAIATTAFARSQLIDAIQDNKDTFIYCDTDSVHLKLPVHKLPNNLILHDSRFGSWSDEWPFVERGEVVKAYYSGAKRYMVVFEKNNKLINLVKVAGISNLEWKENVTMEQFRDHIENQTPIKNGNMQRSKYIRVDDKKITLEGVFLKNIDKVLR